MPSPTNAAEAAHEITAANVVASEVATTVPRRIPRDGVVTSGGLRLPPVGFGTYQLMGRAGADVIASALRNGYRLLDSAFSYENEGAVGLAVRQSGVPREEIIVTSKLHGRHHGYHEALSVIEESMFRTGLNHIDLYLIHWPNPRVDLYVEAWRALIDACVRGLVGHIGVCNFNTEHIDRLIDETGVAPEVNQVELHPYFPQTELLEYHRRRDIVTQAWGPIGRGTDLLEDPVIAGIAASHGASPAQAVLAWHLAVGAIPLPKAASPQRQLENLDIFRLELSEDEVAAITSLARPDGRTGGQDPATFEEL